MNSPMISVIIPLYNKQEYLKEALESVINQSYTDSEIIIVNDGSTDRSLDIVNKYKEKCDRIIVVDQENQGASAARNKGLSIAKGKYIIMMDADDTIHSEMHENMVKAAELHNTDIVVCNYNVITSKGSKKVNYNYPCGVCHNRAYIENVVIPNSIGFSNSALPISVHVTLLINRNIYMSNNIRYDESYKKEEDKPVVMQCINCANSIVFVEGYYYNYIKREDSLISKYSPRFDNIIKTLGFYEKIFNGICDFSSVVWAEYYLKFFEESIQYVLIHRKSGICVKKEIMHIISHERSKKMFARLTEPAPVIKMYKKEKYVAVYNYYMRKNIKFRIKLFVRNLIK